jgi:abelson tyrosine-protein kinase 1
LLFESFANLLPSNWLLGFSREIANLASRADSENENQEITPDTDTDSQEQMAKHPMMMPPQAPMQNSFKRAPVMGNRGLETRNSKRTSQRKTPLAPVNMSASPPSQTVVGALEVQNVKRAINRYGTLPKGARIGAYLESLRQNGESGSPPGNSVSPPTQNSHTNGNGLVMPTPESVSNHSPRAALKVQPQMIRSNSSGGVTMTNSATASLTKLQRHRTTTDGTMMTTFSSFRSTGSNNSPKRAMPAPTLADLEFPPPPVDLPPPPEEFDGNNQFHHDIPPKHVQINNDVSNTAPSVEEASTRFGVSLRKREPSTDSCSSLGSPANDLIDPSSKSPYNDVPKSVDPASMLMSELAENMSVKQPKPTTPKPVLPVANETNGIPFKAQLKKVEPKKVNKDPPKDEITTSIIDFKSRLRKVDDGADEINKINSKSDNKLISDVKPNNNNTMNNGKKTEIKIDVVDDKKKDAGDVKSSEIIGEDDKRKSTGSISSLKKLWEAKELAPAGEQVNQLSPKMGSKKKDDNDDNHNNNHNTSPSNGHHESGMDPPVAKKPAVPVKPSKFTIYATPIQQSIPKVIENNNHSTLVNAMSSTNSAAPASRENILELVQMVECNLKIPVNLITATQWLQLSDKLNVIQSSCVTYADNESMPLHSKFQFRELVTRVENQSNCLRSAGQKNVQDNEKLLVEVGQSLKQLSNALHR